MSILSSLPKPLLDDIVNNRCIPIIGAGFSKNAILRNGGDMPLWKDIGEYFSRQLGEDIGLSPLESISAFCHEFNKPTAIDQLRELLHIYDADPGPAHLSFVRLPFDIVVTTNFDLLLEKAYDNEKIHYHSVTEDEQLSTSLVNEISSSLKNIPPYRPRIVLKIHGDVNHVRNMVLTEEDYDLFIDHHPLMSTVVSYLLITRTPLFIGYSLEDPDFRGLWQIIGSRLKFLRRKAYALSPGSKSRDISRYERRGVKLVLLNQE